MTDVVPTTALSEIKLRLLCHDDIERIKVLCGEWFPIEYPDSWYHDITSNKKFFSLAATFRGGIVGMIVAEIKSRTKVHKEDGDILASSFPVDTQVAYILSLGVVKEFRKHGIGSLLLDSLKEHISTTAQDHCKAIYLHVLTTNNTAIHFYENRDFKQHHYLPEFTGKHRICCAVFCRGRASLPRAALSTAEQCEDRQVTTVQGGRD
ncbi:hypothetical protein G5714_003673 [Onychostoma macrolepis]|uniref:N-alpha-acetyltransferase 60 n=1 Tax=Onychostoma macrolepis TaxID=369639 RepID=A0A7J6DBF5_9TELE|nr:hypothetical protein G5714_003673 [Onychostoma macrolepis]